MNPIRITLLTCLALTLVRGALAEPPAQPLVLQPGAFHHYVEDFNKTDHELYPGVIPNAAAWDFLKANIPLLDCPDQEIATTYYFRWWTYRKHIQQTPVGFIVDEFLPKVRVCVSLPTAGKSPPRKRSRASPGDCLHLPPPKLRQADRNRGGGSGR